MGSVMLAGYKVVTAMDRTKLVPVCRIPSTNAVKRMCLARANCNNNMQAIVLYSNSHGHKKIS